MTPGSLLARTTRVKIILLTDQSIRLEPDEGPMTIEALEPDQQFSPFHMLASSLATCTWSVLYSWATHTGQSADDLVLDVSWEFAEQPTRVAEIVLTFDWPSLPAKKLDAAKRVAAMCTIHETLHTPPKVVTEPKPRPGAHAAPDGSVDAAHEPAHRPS